ncbi:MAG TPA: DUF3168 domain-containing protein [Thermoguttaceae bacterium]|nr:DUF3168 domain-containing protein [Thermoguttaceae bacterium]
MEVEDEIRTALLAMSAVTALVGTGDSARIRSYELAAIDNREEEHIIIEVDSKPRENTIDGDGAMVMAQVNLSCRAPTRKRADGLAAAVKTNGTSRGTGLAWYGGSGTAFDSWLEDETPSKIRWGDNSKRLWHTVEQSYVVQFPESV